MEKINPLFPKTRIFRQKYEPFFFKRGHANFKKIDPFSVEFRTMMRTLSMVEWWDRAIIKLKVITIIVASPSSSPSL